MNTDQKHKIVSRLKLFPNPIIMIDSEFKCVYCNKRNFIKIGDSIADYFDGPIELTGNSVREAAFVYVNTAYCARISPLAESLFLCELFSRGDVMKIAACTDIYTYLDRFLMILENNTLDLLKLSEKSDDSDVMEEHLISIEKSILNIKAYAEMSRDKSQREVIDVRKMILDFQHFFNTKMSSTGKWIEVMGTEGVYLISADKRHTVMALLNAFQNAVSFSPKKTALQVMYYKKSNSKMIGIRITNATNSYGNLMRKIKIDEYSRGMGLTIIKRFVEDADGEFSYENLPGKFVVDIKLPEYQQEVLYQFTDIESIQYTEEELAAINVFVRESVLHTI